VISQTHLILNLKIINMNNSKHIFTLGSNTSISAAQRTPSLLQQLKSCTKSGGERVYQLFEKELSTLYELSQTIHSGGESIWFTGTDDKKLPITYMVDGNASIIIGVNLTEQGKEVLKKSRSTPTEMGYFYVVMNIIDDPASNNTVSATQIASGTLAYQGAGIPDIEAGDGLKTIIEKTVETIKKFVSKVIDTLAEEGGTESIKAVKESVGDIAEESAVEGEEIGISEGKSIIADISFATLAESFNLVADIGVLILGTVLVALSKQINSFVRFYNNTNQELDFRITFIKKDCEVISSPVLPGNPIYIPGISPAWTPSEFIGSDPIHFINMTFVNTDKLKGVGYVLEVRENSDDILPLFRALVDIPNNGKNSLYVSFDTDDTQFEFWNTYKDRNQELMMQTTNDSYTLTISTNQIDERSPSPIDLSKGYNFEHVIILDSKP